MHVQMLAPMCANRDLATDTENDFVTGGRESEMKPERKWMRFKPLISSWRRGGRDELMKRWL